MAISLTAWSILWRNKQTDASSAEPFGRRLSLAERRLSDLSQEVLASPDTIYLYSIDPDKMMPATNESTQKYFQDYAILGQLELTNKEQRAALLTALYKGLGEAQKRDVKCFNPRHGITATKGTNKIDLLICFECLSGYEFTPDCPEQSRQCRGHHFRTSKTPRDTFNDMLKKANIPLPKER